MSRTSRMVLVLSIFAVAGVVVLGMMAHRYGSILDRREETRQRSERRVAAARTVGEQEALRLVDAFIHARAGRSSESEPSDAELAGAGLDRESYLEMDTMLRAWKNDATAIADPFRVAFSLRREELEVMGR